MNKIKFKVESLRRVPNPMGNFDPSTKKKTPDMYIVVANVQDIPDKISTKPNPREQNMRTKVAQKIKDGLRSDNTPFFLLNRGMLISAKDIKFENMNSEVILFMEDDNLHGIIDGGHTHKAIIENRDEIKNKVEQFVKIEILTGIEDVFEDLAAARNTSVQVQEKAIAELKKKFDIIKNAIENEPFSKDIAYKENDDKSIDISHILTLVHMFNLDRYSDRNKMPVVSYSSKYSCIKDYIKTYDNNLGNNQKNNAYYKLSNIMVDIFKLYDYIEVNMGSKYKESHKKGKYGSVKGVERSQNSSGFKSYFYKNSMEYKSPKAFLYPILGSFRALTEEKNGMYQWKTDPFKYFDKIGKDLVYETVDRSRTLGNNPNAVGKDSGHWKQLYQNILTEYVLNEMK